MLDPVGTGVAIQIRLYHRYLTDVEVLLWILGILSSGVLLGVLYLERIQSDPDA